MKRRRRYYSGSQVTILKPNKDRDCNPSPEQNLVSDHLLLKVPIIKVKRREYNDKSDNEEYNALE